MLGIGLVIRSGTVGCCFVQCKELYLQSLSMTFPLALNLWLSISAAIPPANPVIPRSSRLGWEFVLQGQEVLPIYNGRHWGGRNCGCGAGAIGFHTCLNFALSGTRGHE